MYRECRLKRSDLKIKDMWWNSILKHLGESSLMNEDGQTYIWVIFQEFIFLEVLAQTISKRVPLTIRYHSNFEGCRRSQ